jgi:hypothetical protein
MKTDKEIREYVKIQFGHLPKAEQRKARADLEYVRDFYEADGITRFTCFTAMFHGRSTKRYGAEQAAGGPLLPPGIDWNRGRGCVSKYVTRDF